MIAAGAARQLLLRHSFASIAGIPAAVSCRASSPSSFGDISSGIAQAFTKISCRHIMSTAFVPTCDLYDEYLDKARVPALPWRSFGGRKAFCGPAVTIKCFEDNSRLKEQVESAGDGRVLVVDAGGSHRCAVMGDMLADHAASNQWAGVIVHGCVRDVDALAKIDVGIVALGCTPRKSTRRGEGQLDLPIKIGDVECRPGDYVFCDSDGVLILTSQQVNERESKKM